MTETTYNLLSVKIGYILFFSRGVLLSSLFYSAIMHKNKRLKPLFYYSLFALIIALFEIIVIYLANNQYPIIISILQKLDISNTFFISPLYYINEIYFISLYFSILLVNNKIYYWGIFLTISEIVNTFFFEGYKDAQLFGLSAFSINGLVLSLLYIQSVLKNEIKTNTLKNSYFIIAVSIAIPYLAFILYYILTHFLFINNTILFYKISIFRMIIESLCLLLMAYGITLAKKYIPTK